MPRSLAGSASDYPDPPEPDQPIPTLGELLRGAGYRCFATGKWHNDGNKGERGEKPYFAKSFDAGAELFFGGMDEHYGTRVFEFNPAGEYPMDNAHEGEKHSTDLFTDAAIDFINGYDRGDEAEQPLFLYLAYTAPHDPRTPPPEYAEMYPPESIPVPENFLPEHPFNNGEMEIRDEKLCPWPRTPQMIQKEIADYYAMTTHMDAAVGRLHEALAKRGFTQENTLFVHTADHGLSVGQHGLLGKQNMYEHSVRVPLILAGAGVQAGQVSNALCYNHDLFPTLLEAADVPVPETNRFRSLMGLARGERTTHRESVLSVYRSVQRMVRVGAYKLIRYDVAGQERFQLFNVEEDPAEVRDLAGLPEYAEKLEQMKGRLMRWRRAVDDLGL
jgi:arylsulfatase A-like enzyme